MKKIILSFTLICFLGIVNTFAQSSNSKTTTPATAASATEKANPAVQTQSGNKSVATPATVKTEVKSESKHSCCSHSSKSCCKSKDGDMKMEGNTKESEKSDSKK